MKTFFITKLKQNFAFISFLYAILISSLFFIPFIIYDKGLFLYYGDFNVQEIPFYKLAHDAILNGNIFWNFNTDLGANFIGSYSFYMLGSPFFYLTLAFSSKVVPYLMAPLLILKLGFASLFSYLYLSRYVKNKNFAVIGALLYTFSGFSIYNIFFNHFHEAILVFPLLLYSLDEFMYKDKKFIFAFCVFLSSCMNYYFFAGQVVFIIIYFTIKVLEKDYIITLKKFLLLSFESIIGTLLSSFLLLPAFLSAIQNPRTNNFPTGFYALLYSFEQRYLHIIESFFFPPDIPARANFTPDSQAKWASVAAYLPLFGMTGVITFIKSSKRSWIKSILLVLFFMAMVPILNSSFQLFNQTFYTRWFYMLTLIMSLATIISMDGSNYDWKFGIKWTLITTIIIALPIAIIPKKINVNNKETLTLGLMQYRDRFFIYVAIAILSIALVSFLINNIKYPRLFIKLTNIILSITIIVSSCFILCLGKTNYGKTHEFFIPHCINGKDKICLPDTKACRCDVYNGLDNQAMFFDIPTIQAFHTIVPGSIMEFYPSIGVKRDVASRPDISKYGLRALTSCRWLFSYKDNPNQLNENSIPGFEYYGLQNNFNIFENQYFIPYGFTYDSYITIDEFKSIPENLRHLALLKAIVLDEKDAQKYNSILNHANPILFKYSKQDYYNDCINRKDLSCSYFDYDNKGFSATIDVQDSSDKIVFFSIPFENGWSAKVNGNPVEIIKSNIGFMSVVVPGGTKSTIRFDYFTPGLKLGIVITILSLLLFILYIVVQTINKKIKKSTF